MNGVFWAWITVAKKPIVKVTWAEMARDVVIGAMDRGQLMFLGMLVLLIVFTARVPNSSLLIIAKEILNRFEQGSLVGWIAWLITSVAWFFHSRWQRGVCDRELARVVDERNAAQKQLDTQELIQSSREGKQGKKR